MEQTENLAALFRLLYLVPSVVIVLAALGGCWSVRHRRPELAWTSWIGAWLLLAVGAAWLSAGFLPLVPRAGFSILASGGAVLAAMLIVPWRELPEGRWRWSRRAAWFGRAAFGVGVATLLLPILHEFFFIVFGMV